MSTQIYLHNISNVPNCEKILTGLYYGGDADFDKLKNIPGNIVRS